MAAQFNPNWHDAQTRDPTGESIAWLRARAAHARAELSTTTDARLRSYLEARASQADNEAAARERALSRILAADAEKQARGLTVPVFQEKEAA